MLIGLLSAPGCGLERHLLAARLPGSFDLQAGLPRISLELAVETGWRWLAAQPDARLIVAISADGHQFETPANYRHRQVRAAGLQRPEDVRALLALDGHWPNWLELPASLTPAQGLELVQEYTRGVAA